MPKARVAVDGQTLKVADVVRVAREAQQVTLAPAARKRMQASRQVVEQIVEDGRTAYGITTGFGEFANVRIGPDKIVKLQRNLLLSHAVGVGDLLPTEIVRAALVVRANALAKGYSGVRPLIVETLLGMLNKGLHPQVPSKGSLGASGDLAPLAHMCLPIIGQGKAEYGGLVLDGGAAMRRAGLEVVELQAKEGLALLNGTAFMTGIGALAVQDAYDLMEDAQVAGAMSLEALLGTDQVFRPEVGRLRPHPGQVAVAKNMARLLKGSKILASHRESEHRVQDAYALRCMPQVLGASLDVVRWAEQVVATELNSVTDNPLILPATGSLSAGNFHGQPLAYAMDFLAIGTAEVASIAERRIDRLVNPHVSEMKAFLVESGGLNSGFMVAQYTAAALVSENKVLCHPASVDSIPTSANQEDHVSMGMAAAMKLRTVVENAALVVALEYLTAAQGLDLRRPLAPAKGLQAVHATIRVAVARLEQDRVLAPDVAAIRALMRRGALRKAVVDAGVPIDRRPGARR